MGSPTQTGLGAPAMQKGRSPLVSLVGAGPGDPGLLTVKGQRRLQEAEVVVYDRLIEPALLDHAPPGAELIYAGKGPDGHTLTQAEINDLLVERARRGRRVVRLKGGDPFVFGRGGEEASALAAAAVPFEVVPGVTAAIGALAYAGIPATDRRFSSSVAIVTGRPGEDGSGRGRSAKPWRALAGRADTLIVLMGLGALAEIVDDLLAEGLPPSTPAAVVHWGATPRQRTARGTLGTIVAAAAGLGAPAALVVGDVVGLADSLGWFEARPLFGMRIAVTRSLERAGSLCDRLLELGADAVELPAIGFQPPDDPSPLDDALRRLAGFDWMVLASPTAVDYTLGRLRSLGADARAFGGARIAAVGPATAVALEGHGLRADLVPATATADGLLKDLAAVAVAGTRVLLPRTDIADDTIPAGLGRLGAVVTEVVAYRTTVPEGLGDALQRVLARGLDLVCYSSSSTVNHLVRALGSQSASALAGVPAACIGPATAAAARDAGLNVVVEAAEHTVPGLAHAIVAWRAAEEVSRRDH